MNGKIQHVARNKGFGLIVGDDGQDYFMHRRAITDGAVFEQLREGQAVTFDASQGPKGKRAESVRLVST